MANKVANYIVELAAKCHYSDINHAIITVKRYVKYEDILHYIKCPCNTSCFTVSKLFQK